MRRFLFAKMVVILCVFCQCSWSFAGTECDYDNIQTLLACMKTDQPVDGLFILDVSDPAKPVSLFINHYDPKVENLLESYYNSLPPLSTLDKSPLADMATDRIISDKGAKIGIVIYQPKGFDKTVELVEDKRNTILGKDISTLLTLVSRQLAAQKKFHYESSVMLEKRAYLSLVISDKEKKNLYSHKIATGPSEHFYLSADIRINNIKELKYDSSTGSVREKNQPNAVYLGINYMLGDLLSKDIDAKNFWKYLSIKGMLRISEKPYETVGVGVSYRVPSFEIGGFKLDTVSPFAAVSWTLADKVQNGNVKSQDHYGKAQWIFGLSFNLDRALEWVKAK